MNSLDADPPGAEPIEGEVFHSGERRLQLHFGVRERVSQNGRRAIQPAMTGVHAEFLRSLSYLIIGARDGQGRLWATMVFGTPGFVVPRSDVVLDIGARPAGIDPAGAGLEQGASVGLLGIVLAERRRIRVNGSVARSTATGLRVDVVQSYNNCPQYIWPRTPGPVEAPNVTVWAPVRQATLASPAVRQAVEAADTFFIASGYRSQPGDAANIDDGIDVSHRGGRPGFIRIDGGVLSWPEYRGNWYFNTLGNLLVDGNCGLLIPDFRSGAVLQIQGHATIVLDPDEPVRDGLDEGLNVNAEVRVTVLQVLVRPGMIPPNWQLSSRARTKDVEL
ncbi:hypothetical protein CAL29_14325 [Bordetella genomosp. 10]|uniref:Uncharacterized protein n=1 Tax=Bordetella genomosp. 10 TaxID=1416804 RepID=A0A261SE62_9BORD|nr:pyridoxamine 5'-phosphate oxidase family protein [Bordetella genomosp. 10]OZI34663.1 hypothetical protein CAL29_14325 [Bordetella genomosp. 10]